MNDAITPAVFALVTLSFVIRDHFQSRKIRKLREEVHEAEHEAAKWEETARRLGPEHFPPRLELGEEFTNGYAVYKVVMVEQREATRGTIELVRRIK